MKVTLIDGTEIECTLQEFIELKKQGMVGGQLPAKTSVAPILPQQHSNPQDDLSEKMKLKEEGKIKAVRWTDAELKVLLTFYSNKEGEHIPRREMSMLENLLPGRSRIDISQKASELKEKGLIVPKQSITPAPSIFGKAPRASSISKLVPEDEQVVRQNAHLQVAEIAKLIKMDKQRLTYILNRFYGGLRKIRKSLGVKGTMNMSDEHKQRSRERMTFISKQAGYYMNKYNWDREKAYSQAADDWDNKKMTLSSLNNRPQIKSSVPTRVIEFPRFNMLTLEGNKILEDITKNIIGIGGSITYKEIQYVPLRDDNWTVTKWKEFVEEYLRSSAQIADSFMAPNKFKIKVGDNGFITIRYGD